jgi:hypothetical protein
MVAALAKVPEYGSITETRDKAATARNPQAVRTVFLAK